MIRTFVPAIVAFAIACAATTGVAYVRGRGATEPALSAPSAHDAKPPADSTAPHDTSDIPADTSGGHAGAQPPAPISTGAHAKSDSTKTSDADRTAIAAADSGRATGGSKAPTTDTAHPTPAAPAQLDEGRLTKVFSAMNPRDAARVLEQMTDADVVEILAGLTDRRAGELLALLQAPRAATLAKALRNHVRKSS